MLLCAAQSEGETREEEAGKLIKFDAISRVNFRQAIWSTLWTRQQ